MNVLDEIGLSQMKPKDQVPKFNVGDTVRVHFRIVEGEKERVQIFEGVVISRKGGEGPMARFTVRRVAYNEGVERVFPLHSPRVVKVEVTREGSVRRAKLHYLRGLSGKAARVKAKARATGKKALAEATTSDAAKRVAAAEAEAASSEKTEGTPAEPEAAAETPEIEAADAEEPKDSEEKASD